VLREGRLAAANLNASRATCHSRTAGPNADGSLSALTTHIRGPTVQINAHSVRYWQLLGTYSRVDSPCIHVSTVNVKVSLVKAVKAYGRRGDIAPLILNLDNRCTSRSVRFITNGRSSGTLCTASWVDADADRDV